MRIPFAALCVAYAARLVGANLHNNITKLPCPQLYGIPTKSERGTLRLYWWQYTVQAGVLKPLDTDYKCYLRAPHSLRAL